MAGVRSQLEGRLVVERGGVERLDMVLGYDADDPHAVKVIFQGDGVEVEWAISRDVLRAGLECTSGVGDVCIWPLPHRFEIAMSLTSSDGSATVEMNMREVRLFLKATEQLVPYGTENVDVDAVLARIFAVSS